MCVLSHFSHVWLCVTLWTVACQAPLTKGFSRQEHWSGLPCPPSGDLPDAGIEPESHYVSFIGRLVLYHWHHLETLQNLWRQIYCCYSAPKSCPSLQPHGLQLTRFPCLSPSPWVCSNSCPLSWWCYPNISASVAPSLSTLSLSVHQVFSKELALCIRRPRYWSPLTSVLPMNIQCCISCCPRDSQESSPAPQFEESVLRCSAFFMVQHSHPCITTGKTIALTIRTFAGKVMSLLFNMLSRFVISIF